MKTQKTELLELFVQQIGLNEEELQNWFNNRSKKLVVSAASEPEIIPTPLALVYKKENDLSILPGLDLARKDELWGLRLQSGVMVSLLCDELPQTNWNAINEYVSTLRLNGNIGKLPNHHSVLKTWGNKEENLFKKTITVLAKHHIKADGYWGSLWCRKEPDKTLAYFIYLGTGDVIPTYKDVKKKNSRIAVEF